MEDRMSYQLKNATNGKTVKDAISGKPKVFDDLETAQHWASNLERRSRLDATAWNSTRPSKYEVINVS
jgi:hypothetical protein